MQPTVTLVMDHALVQVVICAFVTTLIKFVKRTAILDTHINSPLVMSMVVEKQRNFLLVSTNS